MIAILAFVAFYTVFENRNNQQRQTEHFENTTIAMEHVTENYLEGEQRICDVWARYINSREMSMEEAVAFIRISHVLPNASAHLIYLDSKKGLSTRPHLGTSEEYAVSYDAMDFMNDMSWISEIGTSIVYSKLFIASENWNSFTIWYTLLLPSKTFIGAIMFLCFIVEQKACISMGRIVPQKVLSSESLRTIMPVFLPRFSLTNTFTDESSK